MNNNDMSPSQINHHDISAVLQDDSMIQEKGLLADSYSNNARGQNRVVINQNNDPYDDGDFAKNKEDDEKLDLLKDIRK